MRKSREYHHNKEIELDETWNLCGKEREKREMRDISVGQRPSEMSGGERG